MYKLTIIKVVFGLLTILTMTGCVATTGYYSSSAVYYSNAVPNNFNDDYPLPYIGYATGYYSNTTYVTGGYCCHHYPYYNGLIVPRYYYYW